MRRLLLSASMAAVFVSPALAVSLTDYDGDGLISRNEFQASIVEIAKHADRNRDGIIDRSEFPWTEADLRLFDNNGDGRIMSVGIQEFQDGMALAFDALDADMNNYLDRAEVKAGETIYGIAAPRADHAASL